MNKMTYYSILMFFGALWGYTCGQVFGPAGILLAFPGGLAIGWYGGKYLRRRWGVR